MFKPLIMTKGGKCHKKKVDPHTFNYQCLRAEFGFTCKFVHKFGTLAQLLLFSAEIVNKMALKTFLAEPYLQCPMPRHHPLVCRKKKVGNHIEALCDFVQSIVTVEVVVCEGCPLNFCVSSCSRRECPQVAVMRATLSFRPLRSRDLLLPGTFG